MCTKILISFTDNENIAQNDDILSDIVEKVSQHINSHLYDSVGGVECIFVNKRAIYYRVYNSKV